MENYAGKRILIIEDETDIAMFVTKYLKQSGFVVLHATTGHEGMKILEQEPIKLVILDLMLPDGDGMDFCAQIRQDSTVPIIMLTARDEGNDKISGLEAGADDYMTKPFDVKELVARVKALLRRAEVKPPSAKVIECGDVRMDSAKRVTTLDGQAVSLAPKEFDLLWAVLEKDGEVLSREKLLENVWGYTYFGDTRTVDVHVRQLRRKLGDECPIETVWGKGYKSNMPVKQLQA